ncbi:MAG: hypothetical protein HY301_19120 [Verrucomicrobia bacterium]|nr:hypothetical protein [Verrucomicrobiota bacterium]
MTHQPTNWLSRTLALALALLAAPALRADLVYNGTTNILNNVTNNVSGDVWVGSNSSFTLLILTNNALLNNSGAGRIGDAFGANSNMVRLTGTNTRWLMNSYLVVGFDGSFNQLVISNGAMVMDDAGDVGASIFSSNNVALVTGAGSSWINRHELWVGEDDTGNDLLTIANGGLVSSDLGYIGFGASSGNNEVVVTGANSFWNNTNSLYVGYDGGGNRLTITNGGLVGDGFGYVGYSSNNNTALVTGINSYWSNRNDLHVGESGSGNRLVISNGGLVGNVFGAIGYNASSSNNEVVVTGSNSVWNNSDDLFVGYYGTGNRLTISNGGLVGALFSFIGYESTNNTVLVTGTNSSWSHSNDLYVGDIGASNHLVISNGGWVSDGTGYLGVTSAGSNSDVVVTGTNSIWSNRFELRVGGNGNRLVVSNGGTVFASNAINLGMTLTMSNNVISVGGGFLTVSNAAGTGVLDIRRGTNQLTSGQVNADQLVMTNGAGRFEFTGGTLITRGAFISNGAPFVVGMPGAGTPAVWDARAGASNHFLRGDLIIGSNSSFNQLLVTNGALLSSPLGGGRLGVGAGVSSNMATIAGAGSRWTMGLELYVGYDGPFNRLVVSNGAVVSDSGGYVGFNSGGGSNEVTVTGPGSVWDNSGGDLYVGISGSGNRLVISNGGRVGGNDVGTIGAGASSSNNLVLVAGGGSIWSNNLSVLVGSAGSGNRLVISNGGWVASDDGTIGGSVSASNNEALVTGAGSIWSNNTGLVVGSSGSSNRLVLTNSGTAFASNSVVIGFSANSTSSRVIVDGGTLRVSNATSTGFLDVRRGTNVLNAGLIEANRLVVTNVLGVFEFNGGTLRTGGTTNNNGRVFTVGNGTNAATLQLLGGTHVFSNNLVISSNATLLGTSNIIGTVTNFGTLSPGSSPGSLRIDGNLRLQPSANLTFELGGLIATNQYDQITVTNFVEFAGKLTLTLLNNFLPKPSDTFTLIKFASSSGAFSNAPFAGRVSFSNNLASFAATYTLTNLVIGNVQYVDSDGDGQGDIQEVAAGTDPANPRDFLTITSITRDGLGRYAIVFKSVSGKTYLMEYSANLATWTGVPAAVFTTPSAGLTQWLDDGTLTGGLAVTARHYRVRLQ